MMEADPESAKKSAIPKVIGILMIIFGAFATFGGLFGLLSRGDVPSGYDALKTMSTLTLVFDLLGVGVGGLQAYTGIKLIGYKDTAPKLAITWAILNIVTTLVFWSLMYLWLRPKLGPMGEIAMGFVAIFRAFISVAWSVVALVLVSTKSSREACTNY